MTLYAKLKILQVFNHIMLLIGAAYVINTGEWQWLILSATMHLFMGPIATSAGLHRLLSHKAYQTSRFWEVTLTILGSLAMMGSSITWVGTHRLHHTTSDKKNDPHSPYTNRDSVDDRKFSWYMAFKGWFNLWNVDKFSPRYVADLLRDPLQVFIHKHYYKLIWSLIVIVGIINPLVVIFALAIPACLVLHATAFIVVVSHVHGYRTYNTSDESRNSWISSIATLGDGWHNNHHANPGNWTTHEKWWEIDPMGWFIMLIKKD